MVKSGNKIEYVIEQENIFGEERAASGNSIVHLRSRFGGKLMFTWKFTGQVFRIKYTYFVLPRHDTTQRGRDPVLLVLKHIPY